MAGAASEVKLRSTNSLSLREGGGEGVDARVALRVWR